MSLDVANFIAAKCKNFLDVSGKLMLTLRNVGGERKRLLALKPSREAAAATPKLDSSFDSLAEQFEALVKARHELFLDLQKKSQLATNVMRKANSMATAAWISHAELRELAAELEDIVVEGFTQMEQFDLSPIEIGFTLDRERFIALLKAPPASAASSSAQKKVEPAAPDAK